MKLNIDKPFLWIPVDRDAPEVKLEFFLDNEKVQEIDVCLGTAASRTFYGAWDVSAFLGKELSLSGPHTPDFLLCDKAPENDYAYRPKLHFSPYVGWHNDPNGMVYENGVYHLYYQWNPYGVCWGNMHWGHALSKDLLHWEQEPAALAPDELGTVYSGCAWPDVTGRAGFGPDTLLFYYTAAGGRNKWSKDAGNLFTQRLAYSSDHGRTLRKSDRFLIGHIANENRDPKVFYHEESKGYIMPLYLDQYEFAIFRSEDLLHWEETQRFSQEGMWECPDLLKLSVEGTKETKWCFLSADGYYLTGSFDGYRFQPESRRKSMYATSLPYAAQSFAGLKDRSVMMAWLRMENTRGNYHGVMSLPLELSLRKENGDYILSMKPARELSALPWKKQALSQEAVSLEGQPAMLELSFSPESQNAAVIEIGETRIEADVSRGLLLINQKEIPFPSGDLKDLTLIVDQEVIELFGRCGTIYAAVETEENVLGKEIRLALHDAVTSAFRYSLPED